MCGPGLVRAQNLHRLHPLHRAGMKNKFDPDQVTLQMLRSIVSKASKLLDRGKVFLCKPIDAPATWSWGADKCSWQPVAYWSPAWYAIFLHWLTQYNAKQKYCSVLYQRSTIAWLNKLLIHIKIHIKNKMKNKNTKKTVFLLQNALCKKKTKNYLYSFCFFCFFT